MTAGVGPLVTVCMPSYNYGRFLSQAVESVLGQTYPNFELLIVDNGSNDDSHQIAKNFAAGDPRVQVLMHPGHVNRGVNASLNLGLANASGAYFGLLPADDIYMPDGLERRVALLESALDLGFVYGTSQTLDEDGRPNGHIGGRGPEEMLRHDDTSDLLEAILFHDFVPGAAMLARTEVLRAIGGFDEFVYFNDWYVTIRLLARTTCMFVAGPPVVGYRQHDRHRAAWNLAADRPRKLELFRALWQLSAASGDRLQEPRVRVLLALQRAVQAFRIGERDEAIAAVRNALDVDPSLRDDATYLSWWLDARHGEWSLVLTEAEMRAFLSGLVSTRSVDRALADGSDYTAFAALVLGAAEALTPSVSTRVAWGVLSDQLEALGARLRPRVLASLLAYAVRQPELFRVRSFEKALLVSAGVWPMVAGARRRRAARRHGN